MFEENRQRLVKALKFKLLNRENSRGASYDNHALFKITQGRQVFAI